MRGSGSTNHPGRGLTTLAVVLGVVCVVAGIAFHVLAATVHPAVDPQVGSADGWAFLRWGWLRMTAWAGVLGGTWLAAWGLTAREGSTRRAVSGAP